VAACAFSCAAQTAGLDTFWFPYMGSTLRLVNTFAERAVSFVAVTPFRVYWFVQPIFCRTTIPSFLIWTIRCSGISMGSPKSSYAWMNLSSPISGYSSKSRYFTVYFDVSSAYLAFEIISSSLPFILFSPFTIFGGYDFMAIIADWFTVVFVEFVSTILYFDQMMNFGCTGLYSETQASLA